MKDRDARTKVNSVLIRVDKNEFTLNIYLSLNLKIMFLQINNLYLLLSIGLFEEVVAVEKERWNERSFCWKHYRG